MTLWWLDPQWKETLCARCGCNIWASGGDPDHGVCHDCFMAERMQEQEYDQAMDEAAAQEWARMEEELLAKENKR